jgi:hypothetical protein
MTSCKSQDGFYNLSNKIYSIRKEKAPKFEAQEKRSKEIRKMLFENGKLAFFSNSENLFMLDGYDIETSLNYVTLWNSNGEVNYVFNLNEFELKEESLYSNKLKELIETWDIEDYLQNTKGTPDFGALDIVATKMKVIDDKWLIENITFKEFLIED